MMSETLLVVVVSGGGVLALFKPCDWSTQKNAGPMGVLARYRNICQLRHLGRAKCKHIPDE